MNRRAFLRRFAQVSALCAASPALFASQPEITPPIPPLQYHKGLRTVLVNPEWENASIEIGFIAAGANKRMIQDPWPWRFRNQASAEHFIKVMGEVYKSC